ncbi:hypothetical protein [Streptomyces phytophilus]|uniref:hypothetical protein n=1 Tax=Streptomyces phytophilus TaxID=722715 RepID=UPI0015F0EB35|nr:hypothetical protein [Streptomyces phytophilus]
MPTIKLWLRTDAVRVDDETGEDVPIPRYADAIDLDSLSPRARALAEAVAQMRVTPTRDGDKRNGLVLCQHTTRTVGDVTPGAEGWMSPERAAQPDTMTWKDWDRFPADREMPGEEYLERQARKIPHDYAIVGGVRSSLDWARQRPDPVPSSAASGEDRHLTRDQVLNYMRERGRAISASTWSSYTARGQAPRPDRHISRTPLWAVETIDAYLDGSWKAPA